MMKVKRLPKAFLFFLLLFSANTSVAGYYASWTWPWGDGPLEGVRFATSQEAFNAAKQRVINDIYPLYPPGPREWYGQYVTNESLGTIKEDCLVWRQGCYAFSSYYNDSCPSGQWQPVEGAACEPLPGTPQPQKTIGSDCDSPKPCISSSTANPIQFNTGNKYRIEPDFTVPGNSGLSVIRHYNSQSDRLTNFGHGWRFNFGHQLNFEASTPDDKVTLIRPSGRAYIFYEDATANTWQSDPDVQYTINELTDATNTTTGWTVTTPSDTTETYNANGQLTSITQIDGRVTSFTHNSSDQLSTITGPFGRSLQLTHNSNNLIDSITDPDGAIYRYTYDSNNNLTSVSYPDNTPADHLDNPTRHYHYEDNNFIHALTGITDANGTRYANYAYNSDGKAIMSEHTGGHDRVDITYHTDNTVTVNDANGGTRTYTFETTHGVIKPIAISGDKCPSCNVQSATYDSQGYPASETDWNGNTTNITTNNQGLVTSKTEAAGTPESRTITTEWHPTLRLPTRITEPGRETVMTYDANGNMLSRQVNEVP